MAIFSFYGTIQGRNVGASKHHYPTIFGAVIPQVQFEPWLLSWISGKSHLNFCGAKPSPSLLGTPPQALLPRNYPPSALKLISADPVFDSESYDVDAILNHRLTPHGYEYLVRWKHYSKEHDSWEPAANFDDEATIVNYWNRRKESATATPTDASPAGRE